MVMIMEDFLMLAGQEIVTEKKPSLSFNREKFLALCNADPFLSKLILNGGEIFLYYLNDHNLSTRPDMLMIGRNGGYEFDLSDIWSSSVIVCLNKFNNLRNADAYLRIFGREMKKGSFFTGCFKMSDSSLKAANKKVRTLSGNNSSGKDTRISDEDIVLLLGSAGLDLLDITEINGVAYFLARA